MAVELIRNYGADYPRIIGRFTLPGGTPVTLRRFIIDALSAQQAAIDLFAIIGGVPEEIVADSVARLALVGIEIGHTVYQTDNGFVYIFIGTDPSDAGDWDVYQYGVNNDPTYLESFLRSLNWRLDDGSFIAHKDQSVATPIFLLSSFVRTADGESPYIAETVEAYGIEVEPGVERHYMGKVDPSRVVIYCASDCEVSVDLGFIL